MTTKQQVIDHILQDRYYNDVLETYLSNEDERNEFRQELWLILLEKAEEKLIGYYDAGILKYIYIGIINNQIKSSSSPWYRKYRKNKTHYNGMQLVSPDTNELNNANGTDHLVFRATQYDEQDTFEIILQKKLLIEDRLKYINDKLAELLLKDPALIKEITVFKLHFEEGLSYSKIVKKTNIPKTSVFNCIKLIKNELIKDKKQIKITDPILYDHNN